MCSDGFKCGIYCDDCPNKPDHLPDTGNMVNHPEQPLDMVDPLSDLAVSFKPTAHADMVNNPSHYQSENGIECIEAIRAQMTVDQFAAYCQGNVIKYLWRWRQKGGSESLRKAKWYLYRMIAEVEDAQINN